MLDYVALEADLDREERMIRDTARECGTEATLEIDGEDVEMDRDVLEAIGDPLVHIVRNAVDHGIEPPEVRESAGKPREGTVELRAWRSRDRVTVEVSDDGCGFEVPERWIDLGRRGHFGLLGMAGWLQPDRRRGGLAS